MSEDSKKLITASLGISNPLDYLSPRAQKIAQQKVLTTLTDKQLAERHGLTTRKYNQIIRDENFQAYLKQLQKTSGNDEFVEQMRKQEQHLHSKIFEEVLSRFDSPNALRDLSPDATIEERAEYMKRFAFYSNFGEIMRVFDAADKRARLSTGNATEITEQSNLREEFQERYQKQVIKRRKRQEAIDREKAGLMMDVNSDGTFVEVAQEQNDDSEYEEVSFEEYSITRSNK